MVAKQWLTPWKRSLSLWKALLSWYLAMKKNVTAVIKIREPLIAIYFSRMHRQYKSTKPPMLIQNRSAHLAASLVAP